MKHFLLTCFLLTVFGFANAAKTLVADPTLNSTVGDSRGAVVCSLVKAPEEKVDIRSLSEMTYTAGVVSNVEVDPTFLPKMAEGTNVDLSGLPGEKLMWTGSYSDYSVGVFNASISLVEGNTYKISPFIYTDVAVEFTVDATGAVSIPVQKVTTSGENQISLCKVDTDKGVFSPTDPLKGKVVDGNLFIEDAFGFFVTEGPQFGAYLTIGIMKHAVVGTSNTTFKNNAVSFTDNVMNKANKVLTATNYYSFVYTTASDAIRVMNVPVNSTKSGEMTFTLTPQGTVVVNPQPAIALALYGEYFYYGLTEKTDTDGSLTYSASVLSPIQVSYNATSKTLTMPMWGVAKSSGILGINQSSSFTLPFALDFPQAPVLDLAGTGTKEDPWLLKSAMDFVALGASVLNNTTYRGPQELVIGTTDEYCYPVYRDKYFKLANDIDFSELDMAYTPVGTKTYQFAGNLDGAGFTIKNLTFDDYAYDFCGLFGVQSQYSTIENLNIDNAKVFTLGYTAGALAGYAHGAINNVNVTNSTVFARTGYNVGSVAGYTRNISNCTATGVRIQAIGYIGGIVGRSYGDITNCSAQGTLVQTGKASFTGGIVGHQSKTYNTDPNHTVSGCSFSGIVQSSADQIGLGGIAGGLSYAIMDGCYANANINAISEYQAYLGGLCGTVFDVDIKDSYAAGYVRDDVCTLAGGLVGHVTTSTAVATNKMTNCYASTMLATASTDPLRGIIGGSDKMTITNCYYDAQIAAIENETCGLSTDSLTSGNALKGFDEEKWVFTKGAYPRLKGTDESAIAAVASAALILPAGQTVKAVEDNFTYTIGNDLVWKAAVNGIPNTTGGYAFTFDNGIGKLNYEQQTDTIFVQKGVASKYYIVNIAPVLFEGKGTVEEPWKISTKADLTKLSEMSVKATLTFDGKYLLQTADIDMEGAELDPICKDNTAKLRFLGTYDGNGYTINNLKVQTVGYYTEADVTGTAVVGQVNPKNAKCISWGGLFATIGAGGIVKNVTLGSGCEFDFFQSGGAIAGGVYGTVENCYNYADTKTYYAFGGGIAGQVFEGGKITDCYNGGAVSVNANTAGGIVGQMTKGTVEKCENTGAVKGWNFNPYQKPDIQKTVGGIVGKATSSTITDVANSGDIEAFTEAGGIVGNAAGTLAAPGKIENALNYGFVTSKTSTLSQGAISGVNAFYTYAGCVTDSRLQHIGLVANGAIEGVESLNTEKIVGNDKLFTSGNWTVASNAYPTVTLAKVPAQVALNSTAIVSWAGSEYAQAATSGATLSAGQTWSVAGSDAFAVASDKLTVTMPATGIADGVLTAKANGLERNFYLKSFQFDVFDGDGTTASPFIIATADDYLKLANLTTTTGFNYAGYVFSQTADLDFMGKTFVPAGGIGGSFGAVYDGNNHVAKNVDYNNPTTDKTITTGGFFGIVDYTAEIRNLTLDENSVIATYSNAGGIVGTLYGKVSDCVNKAKVSTYGTLAAGGIAGYAYPGVSILNCSNEGVVTAKTNYAGGILGQAVANANIVVKGCSNKGVVTGATKIGGVIGSASAIVENCTNSGTVTATTSYGAGVIGEALATSSLKDCSNTGTVNAVQYGGGVIAFSAAHSEAAPLNITNCYNTADVVAGTKGYTGGVAGSLGTYVNFVNCYNTGKVSGSTTSTGGLRMGGVVSSVGKFTTLVNCYNTGDIISYSNSGGVVGYSADNTILTDCFNTGNVSGGVATATNVGGVVGSGPSTMTRCYNTGDITGAGYQVGGLNGQNASTPYPMIDCFNTGTVKGATKVGGLIGMGRGKLNGCVNYGKVIANNEVAGIIGVPGNAQAASFLTTVDNCLSVGEVVTTGTNKAAIVGYNSSCKFLELKNNYFDSEILTASQYDTSYGGVAGKTAAELSKTTISDAYENMDACYPMLKAMASNKEYAYYSAFIVFADGETATEVKSPFIVGDAANVDWTASDNLSINEGKVTLLPASTSPAEGWVKKTCGDLSTTYNLTVYASTSVLNELDAVGEFVSVSYYTLDGNQVAEPQPGVVTIRRAVKSDGKVIVSKVLVNK